MTCVGVGVEKYQDGGTKKQINLCNLKGNPRLCSGTFEPLRQAVCGHIIEQTAVPLVEESVF